MTSVADKLMNQAWYMLFDDLLKQAQIASPSVIISHEFLDVLGDLEEFGPCFDDDALWNYKFWEELGL